jgi:dTDP-4-amino-4,6-dideoxygalactose transaminase
MIPLFKVAMNSHQYAVNQVLQSGFVGQGLKVDEFEATFSEVAPFPIVAMNSCTSAIQAVLMHLGVGPDDEVITSPLTCTATNAPILLLGARPIWADVSPSTGNIDPDDVARKITRRTKAIIAVNWTGRPCDYRRLKRLGVPVIEDTAHGPVTGDRSTGDFVCYSFGPIKHFTTGDGGAVATGNASARADLRLLRWYGLDRTSTQDFRCSQNITRPGMKLHMNDINAAIGLANLPLLRTTVEAHKRNADYLWHALWPSRRPYLTLPNHSFHSNYWVFPVLVNRSRESLKSHLAERGIASSQVHARNDKHEAYAFPNGPLPGLDEYDSMHLNVPCGWWLTQEDLDTIVTAIGEWKP